MQVRFIIFLVLLSLITAFALQNSEPILLKIWFWEVQTSVAILMLICTALGALISGVMSFSGYLSSRRKAKSFKAQLKQKEEQIKKLHAEIDNMQGEEESEFEEDHSP